MKEIYFNSLFDMLVYLSRYIIFTVKKGFFNIIVINHANFKSEATETGFRLPEELEAFFCILSSTQNPLIKLLTDFLEE